MKRIILFILIHILMCSFPACSNTENETEKHTEFAINNWTSGLGSVNENSLDESKYSYTLYLTSKTEQLENVKEVSPVIGVNINNKIISNQLPQITVKDDYAEVQGIIIFDTKDLTKEQILDLEPYMTAVKVIMKDNTEYTIDLTRSTN